jgi:hypothetical protein
MMSEDLTNKVLTWASQVATHAAQLSSRQLREEYLAERRRELVFGARAEGTAARDAAILADLRQRGAPDHDRAVSPAGRRATGARLGLLPEMTPARDEAELTCNRFAGRSPQPDSE